MSILTTSQVQLPLYQRPYVWREAALKLLDDIQEHRADADPLDDGGYFVGNILLVGNDDNPETVDLVDGQQRITTLFLTVAYLVSLLRKSAEPMRSLMYFEKFLLDAPDLGECRSRLTSAREALNPVFTSIATMGSVPDTLQGVKNKHFESYACVLAEVKDWVNENLASTADKVDFAKYLTKDVYAIAIEYPDADTALSVFENINSKGETLLQADLMKSAFMKMSSGPHEWAQIDRDWSAIMDNASSRKNGDDGFIRKALLAAVWPPILAVKEAPKTTGLLKGIQSHRKLTGESAGAVLQKIAGFAKALGKFQEDAGLFANGQKSPILARLRRIPSTAEFVSTMVCCMPMALTLASRERLCLVIEAAASVIGLTKTSKNINLTIQPWYVQLRGLDESKVDGFIADFFDAVVAPRLKDFEDAFLRLRVGLPKGKPSDQKWAKHFLLILEDHLRTGLGVQLLNYEAGKKAPAATVTLEHILPQASARAAVLSEEVVYSIGNCTLLEPGKNKSIQDSEYGRKLSMYQKSDFRVTSELAPGNHGGSTKERKFLDQPNVAAVVGYTTFDEVAVGRRAAALLRLLLECWCLETLYCFDASSQRHPSATLLEPVATPPVSSFPFASPESSVPGEAGVGSKVLLSYMGATHAVQLLSADIAPSSRTALNVRKGLGHVVLGKQVGDTFRGALFGGPEGPITLLSVV